jgi:hypothetical protein
MATTSATIIWTVDAVRGLGLTTDVATAGAILGIGRSKAYALAKSNRFPVSILRVGRRYLVPTHALLSLLAPNHGVEQSPAEAAGLRRTPSE